MSDVVEFKDGAEIEVGVLGGFWVVADAAIEYGQKLFWDRGSFKWEQAAGISVADNTVAAINAALASFGTVPVVCASRNPVAANGLAIARIGYGRIF